MELQPLVSIITPCYNVEKYIEDYLKSVINQTYDNIELILVNDGSTDGTEDVILKYKDLIEDRGYTFQYIKKENGGHASAINKGLKVFNGDYITWPDSDDILSLDNIELKVNFITENPEYRIVRGKRIFFTDNIENSVYRDDDNYTFKEDIFYDTFLQRTYASGGCYLLDAKLFFECYPERTIYSGLGSQNWQLTVPALSRSKCGTIDKHVYFIREHSTSFSRRSRTLEEWYERADDLINILLDTFKHSKCNYEKCRNIVEKKYLRNKFELAYKYREKKYLKKYYKLLKQDNSLRLEDTIKFLTIILLPNVLISNLVKLKKSIQSSLK